MQYTAADISSVFGKRGSHDDEVRPKCVEHAFYLRHYVSSQDGINLFVQVKIPSIVQRSQQRTNNLLRLFRRHAPGTCIDGYYRHIRRKERSDSKRAGQDSGLQSHIMEFDPRVARACQIIRDDNDWFQCHAPSACIVFRLYCFQRGWSYTSGFAT